MIREDYNQRFLALLAQLNPAQKKAVEQTEGPVLAIAGPGTGKTHILSARVGQILLQTDAQPHNILCLTFTDAAVNAMRNRLLEFIGPEAHRVHIFTFHSFCNNVIRDNVEYFGSAELEPLTDLERIEAVREVLDGLPHDHLLRARRGEPYFYEKHLQDLFRKMKAEGWTPASVAEEVATYLQGLPQRPEYVYQRRSGPNQKGDPKTALIGDQERRMGLLTAAAELLPLYEKSLNRRRRYDYEDMLLWVINAFTRNENLLRNYQERYLYYLVDEFQDTNGAQSKLLNLLINYWDNPNVFVVGDDDQSIFEFQGARLKNIADFYHQYQNDIEIILLSDNYRSSQHILDVSKSLIERNELRLIKRLGELGLEKALVAKSHFAASTVLPRVAEYPNRAHEEADLVRRIEELRYNGIVLNEIAVIYSKHKQAKNLSLLLEKKGIPYNMRRPVDILTLPMVQKMLRILEWIAKELDRPRGAEDILYEILHHDGWGADIRDIASLGAWRALQEPAPPLGEFLVNLGESLPDGSVLRNAEALRAAALTMFELLAAAPNVGLPALVERLINRTGALQKALDDNDRAWNIQVLATFHRFVMGETARTQRLSLWGLLDVFNRMRANNLSLSIEKVIVSPGMAGGVNLLTAHGAKGLEFRCVFLLDCVSNDWEPSNRGGKSFSYPDTLTFSGDTDALEAARRVFYVAMTRAKERLHISYSSQNYNGSALVKACFVDELLTHPGIELELAEAPPETVLESQVAFLTELKKPTAPRLDEAMLGRLLEGFSLSMTAMNRMLDCPLSFYYENVLRVPAGSSEEAAYGSAIHDALQWAFVRMSASKKKEFPKSDDFVDVFSQQLRRRKASFSVRSFKNFEDSGRHLLARFYTSRVPDWGKNVMVEKNFRMVEWEGIPLTGTIDKAVFLPDGSVELVDYKTGRIDEKRLNRPTPKDAQGGNYWRQLVFYKILFETARFHTQPVRVGAIEYINADEQGHFPVKKLEYTPEDVSNMQALVREVWSRIQSHDFFEGCGKPHCRWCTFVRTLTAPNSWSDEALEGLDDGG